MPSADVVLVVIQDIGLQEYDDTMWEERRIALLSVGIDIDELKAIIFHETAA